MHQRTLLDRNRFIFILLYVIENAIKRLHPKPYEFIIEMNEKGFGKKGVLFYCIVLFRKR